MKNKVGFLLISRNNYSMLKQWNSLYDYGDTVILNIDNGSDEQEKKIGRKYCADLNIHFIESKEPGLQFNIVQSIEFFYKMGIEWIIYSHHDSYPLTEKFIQKINYWVNNPEVKKFGVIGFNVLHNKDEIKCFDHESTPLRSTARCPLEKGGMIYKIKTSKPLKNWLREDLLRGFKNSTRINYNNEIKRPFAVESVFYTTAMVNINQYQRYIVPDSSFTMFLAWDDIAFQFLKNNVYNIVLPNFHYAHDQSLKLKYDLPLKSPIGNQIKREYLYGKWNHHDTWKKKWGFRWNQKYVRSDFKKIKKQYKGTLLMDFYRHDPKNGPLRYFEL